MGALIKEHLSTKIGHPQKEEGEKKKTPYHLPRNALTSLMLRLTGRSYMWVFLPTHPPAWCGGGGGGAQAENEGIKLVPRPRFRSSPLLS